jgi:hypothetical protein
VAQAAPKTKKPAPAKPARKPKPAAVPAPAKPAQKPGPPAAPSRMQKKLEVGPAGDRFEQEADRIADHVMRTPAGDAGAPHPAIAPVSVQREALDSPEEARRGPAQAKLGRHRPAAGPEEREEQHHRAKDGLTLQRATVATPVPAKTEVTPDEDAKKADDCGASMLAGMQKKAADGSGPAPANVQATVDRARAGGGSPLSPETRTDMESRLGRDFGGARVHSGAPAAAAAQAVGAKAFTVGHDVFFGAGRYRPGTNGGNRLLAHELVHTVQQGGGSSRARPARLQRATKGKTEPPTDQNSTIAKGTPKTDDGKVFDPGDSKLGRIEAKRSNGKKGTLFLPALRLPKVLNGLKATADHPIKDLQGQPAKGKDPILSTQPYTYKGASPPSKKLAYQTWVEGMASEGAIDKVRPLITEVQNGKASSAMMRGQDRVYYIIPKREEPGRAHFLLTGTKPELADPKRVADRTNPSHNLLVPSWNKKGNETYFDADHIHDEQLGGADAHTNMWLWQAKANQSAGGDVSGQITTQASTLIKAARAIDFWKKARVKEPNPKGEIRTDWNLVFDKVEAIKGRYSEMHWLRSDICDGQHLQHLRALTDKELASEGLGKEITSGGTPPAFVHVFTNPAGGERRRLARRPNSNPKEPAYYVTDRKDNEIYKGFKLTKDVVYTIRDTIKDGRPNGKMLGKAFDRATGVEFGRNMSFDIRQSRDLGFGGYVDKQEITERVKEAAAKAAAAKKGIAKASPFDVAEAGINADGELYAEGSVTATKALFPGLEFPVSIRPEGLYVDVPIPAAQLNLGPIHVPEASLRLGANENGVFIEGSASLLVDGLGSGQLTAAVGKSGPHISGSFDFDLAFLKDTHASFEYDYATDAFMVKLEQTVPAGALPGVAGGHITATLSRGAVGGTAEGTAQGASATNAAPAPSANAPAAAADGAAGQIGIGLAGELKLAGPLAGAVVEVAWDPKLGVVIAAENIPLPVGKIPGVQDATVSVRARRDPETGAWHVSGAGGASFQIAGVDGKLLVAVDGNAVTIQGNGAFQKGLAKGSVTILATNLQRDADGNPMPDKTADKFTVSGKGAAEIQLGKILRGGVALELTPDGRVIIAGEVSLPPDFPVFGEEKVNKNLFHVKTPDFPIWGVSVAGFGIGVFAFADAELDFDAFAGPGVIKNARAGVTFDLDAPEDAVVDGCGDFSVKAGAGLTLDIGGGLKVELGPAEGDGRVGLDARLGIAAQGDAHLGIHWSRQEGLSLSATVKGTASPQFDVNANARLHVSVDLLLGSIGHTWGPWKKPLGHFGPEMELGISVPVGWSETKGLDFSVDNIALTYPEISPLDIMKSAFLELV